MGASGQGGLRLACRTVARYVHTLLLELAPVLLELAQNRARIGGSVDDRG